MQGIFNVSWNRKTNKYEVSINNEVLNDAITRYSRSLDEGDLDDFPKRMRHKITSWEEDVAESPQSVKAHIYRYVEEQKNDYQDEINVIYSGNRPLELKFNLTPTLPVLPKSKELIEHIPKLRFKKSNGRKAAPLLMEIQSDYVKPNRPDDEKNLKITIPRVTVLENKGSKSPIQRTSLTSPSLVDVRYRKFNPMRVSKPRRPSLVAPTLQPVPEEIMGKLRQYTHGKFWKTLEAKDVINKYSEEFGTPYLITTSVEFKIDWRPLIKKLVLLTDEFSKFETTNNKIAIVMFIRATEEFIEALRTDDLDEIKSAHREFKSAQRAFKNYLESTWMQFGGTPSDTTAYGGNLMAQIKASIKGSLV